MLNVLKIPPIFESEAEQLVFEIEKKTPKAISELMSISDNLAQINWSRFKLGQNGCNENVMHQSSALQVRYIVALMLVV